MTLPARSSIATRSNLSTFITIARLRAPCEVFAVGGVLRAVVAAGAGGDFLRGGGFGSELEGEDVVVGGLGGFFVEVGDVGDFLAVGGDGVAERAAEGEGGGLCRRRRYAG